MARIKNELESYNKKLSTKENILTSLSTRINQIEISTQNELMKYQNSIKQLVDDQKETKNLLETESKDREKSITETSKNLKEIGKKIDLSFDKIEKQFN